MINIRKLGKKGKIIVMVGLLSVFAMSSAAFATSYGYYNTLPTFGHKTLVDGTKDVEGHAKNTTGDCESNFYCWLDYNNNGSWYNCTDDYECVPNATCEMKYSPATPNIGTQVRLRTKIYAPNGIGGQLVRGNIIF